MSQVLRRFAQDTAWAFASMAVAAGIHFILRTFLARHFGAGDLGLYTLAFTVYALGLNFSGFGVGSGLVKYIAESQEDSVRSSIMLTGGIIISFISGFAMGLIAFLLAPVVAERFFKMPELTALLRIVAVAFPFIALEKAALGFLNGTRQMRRFAFINIVQNVLVVILTLAFALTGYGIRYAVLSLLLPMVLMSMVSLLLVARSISWRNVSGSRQSMALVRMLLVFGFYVVLSAAVSALQAYTSTTLLGFFKAEVAVGIFGVVQTVMPILLLPSDAVQAITTPMIAGFWGKGDRANIEDLVNRSMKLVALYAVAVAFVLGLLSRQIMTLLFGADFAAAAVPLQIMLFSGVLMAMLGAVGGALSSTSYVKLVFRISSVTLVLTIVLNLVLIPWLGIVGAAIGAAVTMSVYALLHLYFVQRLIKVKIDRAWFARLLGFALLLAVVAHLAGRVVNPYLAAAVALMVLVAGMLRYFVRPDERTQVIALFIRR